MNDFYYWNIKENKVKKVSKARNKFEQVIYIEKTVIMVLFMTGVLATKSDFLILIFSQPHVVDLRYLKLLILLGQIIPQDVKNAKNLNSFKNKLDEWLNY